MNSEQLGKLTDYVAALNLQQDPFENTLADRFFYADPGLMQRLDLLQHLTQFGDQLLLIAGPEGSGKSTLLSQFRLRAKDSWRICQLDGGKYESAAHLLHDMADYFNTPYGDDNAMIGRELIQHAKSLQQDAGLAIVIIDDADQLNDDSLRALLSLGESPQEALRYLRMILLGDAALESRLMSLGLNNPRNPIIHRLDMQPFDTQQSAAYLMYRLAIAGYSGDSPFSSTEVEAMHKAAGGLPGKLNEFARETLGETIERKLAAKKAARDKPKKTPPPIDPRTSKGQMPKPSLPMLGAAAVLLVGVLWFSGVLDDGDEAELETQPLALPNDVQTVIVDETEPDEPPAPIIRLPREQRIADKTEPTSAPAEQVKQPSEDTAGVEPAAEPETVVAETESTAAGQPEAASASATPESPAPETAADEAVAALQAEVAKELAQIEPAPSAAPEPTLPAPAGKSAASLPAWVESAPAEHYTLQLVGLSKAASAEDYVKQHNLGEKAAIIVSEREGAPWYSVIFGDYPDKDTARAAPLPASLKSVKPWPRTFASVRESATP